MRKNIVFIVIFIAVIGFAIYYANKDQYEDIDPIFHDKPLVELPCDLNKQNCNVKYKGKLIDFSFQQKPLVAMKENKILIKNLPNNMNLSLKLKGINMDMGTITTPLKEKNGVYSSDIVLSACILNTMRYEAEIYQDNRPLGVKIKFDLNQ